MSFNNKEYLKSLYKERNTMLRNRLGGVCVKCGSSKDLEFDHIDPQTKLFNVASNAQIEFSRLLKEVDKCQLLCRSCHRDKTNSELQHQKMIDLVFTCLNCLGNFTVKVSKGRSRKYCSRKCQNQHKYNANWPSDEDLVDLVKTNTMVRVGQICGVSCNAVRKRLRSRNLI